MLRPHKRSITTYLHPCESVINQSHPLHSITSSASLNPRPSYKKFPSHTSNTTSTTKSPFSPGLYFAILTLNHLYQTPKPFNYPTFFTPYQTKPTKHTIPTIPSYPRSSLYTRSDFLGSSLRITPSLSLYPNKSIFQILSFAPTPTMTLCPPNHSPESKLHIILPSFWNTIPDSLNSPAISA